MKGKNIAIIAGLGGLAYYLFIHKKDGSLKQVFQKKTSDPNSLKVAPSLATTPIAAGVKSAPGFDISLPNPDDIVKVASESTSVAPPILPTLIQTLPTSNAPAPVKSQVVSGLSAAPTLSSGLSQAVMLGRTRLRRKMFR